jgi:hypothetical protein
MDNTQLPAEVVERIELEAEGHKKRPHYSNGSPLSVCPQIYLKRGYIAGATEYAIKLHQERQERVHLQKENDIITGNYNELQAKCDTARTLLEKFISRHEAGLLPDMFIYQEIKSFLDGK